MPRILESLFIDGPAGRLETLVETPEDDAPREAALICHPHPQHGGTMHNKVVYRLARALRHGGAAVLRFNFRGVGRSAGSYGHGTGEIEDARACLAWLRARHPSLPYSLAGFSFGARVVLSLGCEAGDAQRLILAGFPTRVPLFSEPTACTVPKFFVQSTHDQYGPREELERKVAEFTGPKSVLWVDAHDHFFAGALDVFEKTIAGLGPAATEGRG